MSLESILWLLAKARIVRGYTRIERGFGTIKETHFRFLGSHWVVEDK